MKKFLSLLLAGTMLFSLAACGEDKEEKDNKPAATESVDTQNVKIVSPEAAVEQYWTSIAAGDYDKYLEVLAPERESSKSREAFDGLNKGFDDGAVVEIEIVEVSYVEDFNGDYEDYAEVEYKLFENGEILYEITSVAVKVDGSWRYLRSTSTR